MPALSAKPQPCDHGAVAENTAGPLSIDAIREEHRRIRRLRFVVDLTASILAQNPDLTIAEAEELIQRAERAAVALFPGSEPQFDLLIRPRLSRIVDERFPRDPSAVN
jgi:hypothetical protein